MGGGQRPQADVEGVAVSFEKMMAAFQSGAMRARVDCEAYYETTRRLNALGISLPPRARLLEIQAPFAKMAVDVLTEVLIPTGYIIADDGADDVVDLLRRTWQANDMDSQFNLAAAEAMVAGSVFWVCAPPDADHEYAAVRAYDSRHARVRIDYRGRAIEGIAVYRTPDGKKAATYYTPDGVQFWAHGNNGWVTDGTGRRDTWGMSIIPMMNRARLKDRYGRSDLAELRSVIDAASRTLTNLQILQEVSSMPLRLLTGTGASDVVDQFPDKMSAYMGNLLTGGPDGDLKQLSGASLDPFINTYRSYALQISAMTGIPPSMMGVASDNNPTSAEALRVAKDRLIARAENKQRQFSDALEQVGRTVAAMNGHPTNGLESLEVTWADAASPSAAAQAQAAIQAFQAGIIGDRTAREFVNLTPEQKRREDARSADVDTMTGRGGVVDGRQEAGDGGQ